MTHLLVEKITSFLQVTIRGIVAQALRSGHLEALLSLFSRLLYNDQKTVSFCDQLEKIDI
ncbi:hypothetical protein AWM79_23720 [Pseudomonas agarici]|uniref:Uncharacterized protein n=1 Tax=Pseudomonas agarici TaxID=46677 RepID=A0A0X1T7M2_PSEAA|nr:hypothetical protein AWM79_23720 [Pseudomonas agarici]